MNTLLRSILMAVLAAALLAAGAAQARSPLLAEIEDAFVRLHEEVGPSVVNITVKSAPQTSSMRGLPEFFRMYGIPGMPDSPEFQMPRPQATGSGFIYDADGHIVTNNHVVDGAESISVRLYNGNEYDAEIVGADPESDLAVIKITPNEKLPVAKLGDSDTLKPGQFAIALGSPRGFEGSLSFGHISALGREGLDGLAVQGLRYQHLIQTDAAINLGNSGGPLCNIDGEVIGINLAIIYGANNIGFAIPVNTAKHVVPALIKDGKVSRGYIGVYLGMLSQDLADGLELPDRKGALITQVNEGQPAEKAGLQAYDVIRRVNGVVIEDSPDLQRKIAQYAPGTTVDLEIWRDEKAIHKSLTLAELPDMETLAQGPGRGAEPRREILGMMVQTLTPEIAEERGVESKTEGVIVMRVVPDSPADDAGLMQGDVITEIGRKAVRNVAEFRARIDELRGTGKLLVRFLRGGGPPQITAIAAPRANQ